MKAALTLATIVLAASLAHAGHQVELIQDLEVPVHHNALEWETDRVEPGIDIEVEIPGWPDERELPYVEFDHELYDIYVRPPIEHDGLNWLPLEQEYPNVTFDGNHPPYELAPPPIRFDNETYLKAYPPVQHDGGRWTAGIVKPRNPFGRAYPVKGLAREWPSVEQDGPGSRAKALPPVSHDGGRWTAGIVKPRNPFGRAYPVKGLAREWPSVEQDGGNSRVKPLPPIRWSDNETYLKAYPPIHFDGNHWPYRVKFPNVALDGFDWPPAKQLLPPVAIY